jgi:hypothetical protein
MMGKLAKLHEVQQLAGRVAALSRFIARLGEKALPFYALMKKSDKKFEWTEEADSVFTAKKSAFHTTSAGRTKGKRAIITIQRSYTLGGEHGVSSRTKQGREGARSSMTSVLPQRSLITI